ARTQRPSRRLGGRKPYEPRVKRAPPARKVMSAGTKATPSESVAKTLWPSTNRLIAAPRLPISLSPRLTLSQLRPIRREVLVLDAFVTPGYEPREAVGG